MDGKRLCRQLRQMLNEESGSNYLDSFTTYDLLNQGAARLNRKIKHLEDTIAITTVADQADYTLPADFVMNIRQDNNGRDLVRYSDGATFNYIPERDDDVRWRNKPYSVTSVSTPTDYSIAYDDTEDAQVSSTATSTAAATAGKCTLTDSSAPFADVQAGDTIHNTTDGSMGVVLSKTSSEILITALFDGTANDWTSGDAYVIQPQAKYKLTLDPPPNTASQTITLDYLRRPKPVYSDYDVFQFPIEYQEALVQYAVGVYKYRSQMIEEANAWFMMAQKTVKDATGMTNKTLNKRRVNVNFKRKQRNY